MSGTPSQGFDITGEKLSLLAPRTVLMPPYTAPQPMLDRVEVDPDGQNLKTVVEGVGTIALEIYHWDNSQEPDAPETRARFASPLLAEEAEPDTQADAPLATKYPYAVIPNHAAYATVLHAPLDAIATEWSEPHDVPELGKIAGSWQITNLFPELKDTGLTGDYLVHVKQQVLGGLAIAVRLDNREPQMRQQLMRDLGVEYRELMSIFHEHPYFPDVATAMAHALTTHKEPKAGEDTHDVDVQQWEATLPDGFQKTDTDGKSGLMEVIVFKTNRVKYGDLRLEPYTPPSPPVYGSGYRGGYDFGGGTRSAMKSFDLGAVETRYRSPVTLKSSGEVPSVKNPTAIAAFRVALVGATRNE